VNNVDFVTPTIGKLDLSEYLTGAGPHTTVMFSSTCTLIASIPVCTATNGSLGRAVHPKSSKFSAGPEVKNVTFSNLSQQVKEQSHSKFQYRRHLQLQTLCQDRSLVSFLLSNAHGGFKGLLSGPGSIGIE